MLKPVRCATCPVAEIEYRRAVSPAGRLLERVLELDFDLKHFKLTLSDITVEERDALSILEQERSKWDKEESDRRRDEWDQQRRSDEARRQAGRTGGV